MSYRYATVVRQLKDDPQNGTEKGRIFIVAGRQRDGYSYDVLDEETGGFQTIKCETLGVVGPSDEEVGKTAIKRWAAGRPEAKQIAERPA